MLNNYYSKGRSVGLLIIIKVLLFCVETCAHVENFATQSLVNKSLIISKEKDEDIERKVNDMWSMIAPMKGMDDTNPAEYKYEALTREGSTFDWHMKLDQANRYGLDWIVNYPTNQIILSLNINQITSSFRQGSDVFALGFSKYGQLDSSDFCIVWYDLSYRIHLQDARTDSNNRLELIDVSRSFCKLVKSSPEQNGRKSRRVRMVNPEAFGADEEALELKAEKRVKHRHLNEDSQISSKNVDSDSIEIVFKRPLDICTSKSNSLYYTIDNGTTHLVWFTMKGPLLSIDGLNLTELVNKNGQHHRQGVDDDPSGGGGGSGSRFEFGMKRVQLIANKVNTTQKTLAKSLNIDIRMDRYEIPAKETTYWCKLFKLPHKFESRRYHITKYEALIDKGNEHVVHHMELFNCANLDANQERNLHNLYESGGWSGDCGGQERPSATKPCRRVILAWAMGAHPLEYPEQVGQSIGGHGYSPYVVLEVHYNNVESRAGLIDNSGLSFHYTSKLRPYDAGILEVGLEYTDKNSIPPNLITPIAGYCVSECTRAALLSGASAVASGKLLEKHKLAPSTTDDGDDDSLKDGIYVFAAQMHTHLAGVASWTEHVREGKLLGELQRDNHYSPHFQEIRLLPKPIHIAPGDALIHYCLYDTRNRVNITLGGYATSDEMCVTYLHYYPRLDLEVCKSSVDTSALEAYFAYLAKEEAQQTSETLLEAHLDDSGGGGVGAKSVSENYRSIEWSAKRSRELIQFYSNAPLSVQCNKSNGDRFPGYWNGVTPTRMWADSMGAEPYNTKTLGGQQLVEYRGRGFGRRHAQCNLSAGS